MSAWTMINWGAWAASAVIALVILLDFIGVEKRRKERGE